MNYFLVDYENVNVAGLDGVSNLTENDTVIIFYSINADNLTFDIHRKIIESKATFKFQKILLKEKNALDFQLCSYLGYLISETKDSENSPNNYFIVSNDKGYSILPDYWKKLGFNLKIVSNLSKNEITSSQPAKTFGNLESELNKILPDKSIVSVVLKIINNAETKSEVNNMLGKNFGNQKGGEIYRTIKPLVSDKP